MRLHSQPGSGGTALHSRDCWRLPGTFGFLDARGGFILARSAGGEAEILTLAVAPAARRQGLGRALVGEVLAVAPDAGVPGGGGRQPRGASALPDGRFRASAADAAAYYGPGRDAIVLRR